ncbi:MAG: ATP synthase subunit I [Chromatiaceae bacterium]|nr:ATP synthase subunit I [Chromatiaceae bacterium]MBP6809805.1 ATP synthase subunit I [Chromatiaceae bacterium]MBP8024061.1 ATP synthase subunit I [Chromatiaceae bacterium]MBP9604068.1 ATP synthase subunit I [Chromatiaceae bacterium]
MNSVGGRQIQVPLRMLVLQVVLTLILAVSGLALSQGAALSILIGGGACILATALFAATVFGPYRAGRPEALLGKIVGAEIGKLLLVVGIFVYAFAKVKGLVVPAMLAAYFAVQVLPAMIAPYWGAGSKP